jgi:uncharacterized phage protein gp47/JayE
LIGQEHASPLPMIALDAVYDEIVPETWIAIERPKGTPNRTKTYHRVVETQTYSMSTEGYVAKATLLTVDPPWLFDDPANLERDFADTFLLPGTIVYAQAEALALAEEPLDADIGGDTVELVGVYDGLQSGRVVIVSGERTDIPGVRGVLGSERAMIAVVKQGSQGALCAQVPEGAPPFEQIYYTTEANALGDRLIVGRLRSSFDLSRFRPAQALNQQYCEQVQLSAGLYANAYVPTSLELGGRFPDFVGLLLDPDTFTPFPAGTIPAAQMGRVWAWRISTRPVHTILTFANKLSYKYDSKSVTIYGNVAHATNGQTTGEILGDGDASQALQRFELKQRPLTYVSARTPAGISSTLSIDVNEVAWDQEDNLASLGPLDHAYASRTDDADRTSVVFGNGTHGARVPTGSSNIKATYRYGIGKQGNVDAYQISQLASHPLGAQSVINPLPATGGADRDSRDQARRNIPVALMALDRLVSVEDYASFARAYAGIGKAVSTAISDGRRQIVHVTIAGADDTPIDASSDLYQNLVQSLLGFGDPHRPLQVAVRKAKLLVISAAVQIARDRQWEDVEPRIRAALLDAFGFDARALGQTAFLSEAMSVVQGVDGVSYVDMRVFDSVAEDVNAGQLAALGSTLKLTPYVVAELASLRHDAEAAADPSERIFPAQLVFLTPDIADTLLLTQVGLS